MAVHRRLSWTSPSAAYFEQPLRPLGVLAVEPEGPSGGVPALLGLGQDRLGAGPGLLLGVGHDRPEADAEPGVAVVRCRGRPDLADPLADALERLAPERVDVGVLAADPDGVLGRAAEVHGDRGGRADRRPAALHPVEVALVVERRLRLPLLAHHRQEVVGARVAGGLVGEVAVALLVDVVAAGDHVHRHPARVEGVEGGVRARGQRRREEPGAVREQHAEPLGPVQDLVGHHEPVGHGRGVGDQHPVEAGALVGPGERLDVVRVDDGPDGRARLGLRRDAVDLVGPGGLADLLGGGDPDELDARLML